MIDGDKQEFFGRVQNEDGYEDVIDYKPSSIDADQKPKEDQNDHQEGLRFSDLHPAEEKIVKSGSLQFDIKLGWIPRSQISGPIPIAFAHPDMDDLLSQNIPSSSIIYLGYRPTNTFNVHEQFYNNGQKYPFNQFHLCKSQFLERFFRKYYSDFQFDSSREIGMKTNDSPLVFDSFFQGGNLDFVYRHEGQYRLGIRPDTNTRGHCNYFYFKQVRVTCQKAGRYLFRIVNMSKNKSLYERGMKPFVRTKKKPQWHQGGEHIRYVRSPLSEEFELAKPMYCLKFDYNFEEDDSEVEFCYGIPYVYSDLLMDIEELRKKPNCYVNKLCYSLSGVEIPMVTITERNSSTDNQKQEQDSSEKGKKVIVISGRVHPSETHGSHIINGLIKSLLADTPESELLRKNIIFKIIPMINPDGVIIGNTRTSFSGKDLNRVYTDKIDFVFPEIISVRDFTKKLKQKYGKRLLFFIDVHGHSTRKNSFFFGPEYPVFDEQYTKCRMLAKIFSNKTDIFRYYSCKFRLSSVKEKTCRGYFNSKQIVRTYTHETSVYSYFDFKTRKDQAFDRKSLEDLGCKMMEAIHDYVKITVKLIEIEVPEPIDKKKIKPKQNKTGNKQQDEIEDSDEMGSDKADSQDSSDDFGRNHMQMFYNRINENKEYFFEELMAFNGIKDKQPKKKKKKKVNQQPSDNQEEVEKNIPVVQNKLININLKSQSKPKMKIDWSTRYEFQPKKKQFLEYEKLSNVVFGSNELKISAFENRIQPKISAFSTGQQKKAKYSFVNISPTLNNIKNMDSLSMSRKKQFETTSKWNKNKDYVSAFSTPQINAQTPKLEQKQLLQELSGRAETKKKQLYDRASLEKIVTPTKIDIGIVKQKSSSVIRESRIIYQDRESFRSTSLRVLPRKKSIRNLRDDNSFQRRKTKKNMGQTGLSSKLPSLDRLAGKF